MPAGHSFLALFSAILLIALPSPASPQEGVRLLFAGDIMLSRQVEREIEATSVSPWTALSPLLSGTDFVFGNFEGAIGKPHACPSTLAEKKLCFAVKEEFAPLLRSAGFSAVSLENNHAADLGPESKTLTKAVLEKTGLTGVDFHNSPYFFRVKDVTISLIALNISSGEAIPYAALRQKLRLARKLSDLCVASVHWGNELQEWVSPKQRNLAEWLVSNGADLLLGHHPHVPQSAACVGGKPVFYSLGNHLFDQKYPAAKRGLLADCRINGRTMRCSGLTTRATVQSSFPVLEGPEGTSSAELSSCAVSLHETLAMDGYQLRPLTTATQSSANISLELVREGKTVWRSPAKKLLSAEQFTDGDGRNHLFTIEEHFSVLDKEHSPRPYVYSIRADRFSADWRGSALAWPLIDGKILGEGLPFLCALHRGDSFLAPDPSTKTVRTAAYVWTGFGFSGLQDASALAACTDYFQP